MNGTCRWCGATKNVVGFCQLGCSERAVYAERCIDCRQEFKTGRYGADQCPSCEAKENARHVRESAGDETPHTGYEADLRRKGASQRAHAMSKKAG